MTNLQYVKPKSLSGLLLICTLMLTVTAVAVSQTPVLAQITPSPEKFGSDESSDNGSDGSTDSSSSDDDNESSDSSTDDEESGDETTDESDTDSNEANQLAEAIKNRVKGALSAAGIDSSFLS